MKPWQRTLLPPVLIMCLGVALNYGYVLAHLKYLLRPNATASAQTTRTTPLAPPQEPNTLRIDRLGILAPIRYVDEKSEKIFQAALQNGVVHYPGTAKPGEFGNAYIFGHSSDYAWTKGDYKAVFALLTKMKTGDAIVATDETGQPFTYIVTDIRVVAPNDLSVLDQGDKTKKRLTLQTSYPIGTALKRLIVVADLNL